MRLVAELSNFAFFAHTRSLVGFVSVQVREIFGAVWLDHRNISQHFLTCLEQTRLAQSQIACCKNSPCWPCPKGLVSKAVYKDPAGPCGKHGIQAIFITFRCLSNVKNESVFQVDIRGCLFLVGSCFKYLNISFQTFNLCTGRACTTPASCLRKGQEDDNPS